MRYVFTHWLRPSDAGFPHSDIFGSQLTYSSPKHFGVCSVLHRLLLPTHPPCALHYLIVMNLRECISSLSRAYYSSVHSRFLRLLSYLYILYVALISV